MAESATGGRGAADRSSVFVKAVIFFKGSLYRSSLYFFSILLDTF